MAEGRSGGSRGRCPVSGGLVWLMGWLFTLGYLHLPFWMAVPALILWPYYLGTTIAGK